MHLIAYIGPGGGVAIAASLFTFVITAVATLFAVVFWPVSSLFTLIRGKKVRFRYPFRRTVVLGLDGLDPNVTQRLINAGKLPHMAKLAKHGHFSELETTLPALTPSAWPSFMTGNDASRHGIYDFITRDPNTYLPRLSSFNVTEPKYPFRIGRIVIPFGKARVRMLRKGIPFWRALARAGLEVTVLRVPITFPPEPFRGRLLSGMCVPDLLGSQGTSSLYTTAANTRQSSGGQILPLIFDNNVARPCIYGPLRPRRTKPTRLVHRFRVRRFPHQNMLRFTIGKERFDLQVGEQSEWIKITFRSGLTTIYGQVRIQLIACNPEVEIYMTPVQITPERPAMKISHPRLFGDYLAKMDGPYGTLGLQEDTSALNDGILDEAGFLQQAHVYYQERKAMFFRSLANKADDVTICVFDTPDRIQHMFWRYTDPDHPAHQTGAQHSRYADTIDQLYIEMDRLIGETLKRLPPQTLLLVASDHGFANFRRGVNLNTWLHQHGYLHFLPDATPGGEWLEGVDWSRTQAYALGLTGLFVNLKGRERHGIIEPGDAYSALLGELKAQLEALQDPDVAESNGKPHRAIRRIFITCQHFDGPYRQDGPDLLIGYQAGYRCSWECAKGQTTQEVFTDNTKAWSGDHSIDPALVPGVLIANHPLPCNKARLIDLAPTILDIFGVTPEAPMQGRSLLRPENHEPTGNVSTAIRQDCPEVLIG